MQYFPLFLDLRDRSVLLVGGGEVAARKLELLLEAGARIDVIAPQIAERIERAVASGHARHLAEAFRAEHCAGYWLVIAATDDRATNQAVAAAAERSRLFVNVVDDAALSSAIVPAIVDRSPLIVAVSSGGSAPMLARAVRERIERVLDESLGALAALLQRYRAAIVARFGDLAQRRRFYSRMIDGELPGLLRTGRLAEAERLVESAVSATGPGEDHGTSSGRVLLVGAGPGDPGLLTLHALRALQAADVVLHDRLVGAGVLALVRRDAERIEVGKSGRGPSISQERIHELMLEHVRRGRTVVRLKGGDPFIFGRGGEELDVLRAQGVAVEVVPGITAAIGAAASAQIALTRRGASSGLRIISAESGAEGAPVAWASHARSRDTLAIYMGRSRLAHIGAELIDLGRPATTPVALIENATRPEQRVLHGTLADLGQFSADAALTGPLLLVVGDVAAPRAARAPLALAS